MISPINNPYWYMEASAEWGAHFVQQQDGSAISRKTYARELPTFVAHSRGTFEAGDVSSPGGREYGAFVLAEFLAERFGGATAVEESWRNVGRGFLGTAPTPAIADVAKAHGSSYSAMMVDFRQSMYVLEDAGYGVGFTDPDAQAGGIWRRSMASLTTRPPHTVAHLSDGADDGLVALDGGGAEYVELTAPAGASGLLTISLGGPRRTTLGAVLQLSDYPHVCGSQRIASGGETVHEIAVYLTPGCSRAVLVITNGSRPGSIASFSWSATFNATASIVSSTNVELGVDQYGSLIHDGVGLRRTGDRGTEVLDAGCLCEGWGVGTATYHGSVTTQAWPNGIDLESFRATDASTTVVTRTGPYKVTHEFRAADSADLIQIDVTVTRDLFYEGDGFPPQPDGGPVLYRRVFDFDVEPTPFSEYMTWAKADGGDDSRVVAVTNNGFDPGDPQGAISSLGMSGYADRVGPRDQGGLIQLDLGNIMPGQSVTFTLFYGVSVGRSAALNALDQVGADVYALGEPSTNEAAGNTAIFGYRAASVLTGPSVRAMGRSASAFDPSTILAETTEAPPVVTVVRPLAQS
jgi:hypothetical protein